MDGQKDSGLRDQRRLHKEVGLNCVLMCGEKGGGCLQVEASSVRNDPVSIGPGRKPT